MREYDLVIRGGTIVDGTGVPRRRADLAVKDGRVAMISGNIPAGAAKEIDASGCYVAPGAIDLHTHYDAQLNWDPYASLSGWFGVTSLTIGQCGFGFAPTRPEDRDLNMRMMDRIEAIPLKSMRLGMRWDWETFPEYLDSLENQGLGLNVGALFPFSPMRGYVLGMYPARERTSVTGAELNEMKRIFHEAMQAGAFGFALDKNLEDRAEDGSVLPTVVASDEEFLALADVMRGFGVGHIGVTIGSGLTLEERTGARDLSEQLMRRSGRPLHLLDAQLGEGRDWLKACRADNLPLVTQLVCTPFDSEFKLAEYNLYDYMPNWVQPLVGSPEERAAQAKSPGDPPGYEGRRGENPPLPHHLEHRQGFGDGTRAQRPVRGQDRQRGRRNDRQTPRRRLPRSCLGRRPGNCFRPPHHALRGRHRKGRPAVQGPLRSHLCFRWWCPHEVCHRKYVARLLAHVLDQRQGDHVAGAGSLQDEHHARLVRRLQGPRHTSGR